MTACKWFRRLVNLFIDIFSIEIISIIVMSLLKLMRIDINHKFMIGNNVSIYYTSFSIFLLVFMIYYFMLEYFTGKTFGKLITRTQVIQVEGSVSKKYKVLFIRTLSRLFIFEFFWYLKDRPKGLHDRLSKTIVIKDSDYHPPQASI